MLEKFPLRGEIIKLWQDLQGNRRLHVTFLAAFTILAVNYILEFGDAISAREQRLVSIRRQIGQIYESGRDLGVIEGQAEKIRAERMHLETRLGGYPTEAIAQAAIAEWLSAGFKQFGVTNPGISQVTVQSLGVDAAGKLAAVSGARGDSLRELKVSLSFGYTPETLFNALALIEGGQRVSGVDSLNVTPSRVEMGVRVMTRIGSGYTKPTEAVPDVSGKSEKVADLSRLPISETQSAPVLPVTQRIKW